MLKEELIALIKEVTTRKSESQHIECKKAAGGTPQRLYDTLSAFANQNGGGIILFGIDEQNGYEVSGVYDPQDIQVKVMNQSLQMNPILRPVLTVAEIEGKYVVSAEISECEIFEKPCFYTGAGRIRGSYIRVGESDQPMTEYEVYSYEAFKRKIEDEIRVVERAAMTTFDRDSLTEYFIKLRRIKTNLAKQSDEKILELQGLCQDGKPTVAGLMLFGEYPQAYMPQLVITAMVVPGTQIGDIGEKNERFIDNKRIEGTIPQMIEEAMAFVWRNSRSATVINAAGARDDRDEYPMKAVRELVINALVHRDYSIHTDHSPIRLILYRDRMEIENPGGLYGRMTLDALGHTASDTRNPFIAGGLETLLLTENRYSGIPTARMEMLRAGLPEPVFESLHGVFKATLFNSKESVNMKKEETAAYGGEDDVEGLILKFCSQPKSREEIANELKMNSTYYVVTKYLRPLIQSGKLAMTIPDTPRSRSQQYFTVDNSIS